VRVATWNVNGLRARLGFVRLWLRERKPDLVGLQELKLHDEHFPHEAFREEGYFASVHGQKGWNGVAVLSREPVQVAQCGLPGQEAFGARLIGVRAGDLDFTTFYCPNGKHIGHEDFPRKLAWLDALTAHLGARPDPARPAVACGDLNVCPAPIDSWNEAALHGRIFHTDAERERFQRLLASGWVDVFRRLHPETPAFSWWDYRAGCFHRGQGLRIDLLLATEPLAARAARAEIDREWRKKKDGLTPSDHAPVVAEL
jgi:exodeoxyribonuclease-3